MLLSLIFRPTVDMHAQATTTDWRRVDFVASSRWRTLSRGSHENGAADFLASGAHPSDEPLDTDIVLDPQDPGFAQTGLEVRSPIRIHRLLANNVIVETPMSNPDSTRLTRTVTKSSSLSQRVGFDESCFRDG